MENYRLHQAVPCRDSREVSPRMRDGLQDLPLPVPARTVAIPFNQRVPPPLHHERCDAAFVTAQSLENHLEGNAHRQKGVAARKTSEEELAVALRAAGLQLRRERCVHFKDFSTVKGKK
jgi:hypothetical protein